MDIEKLKAAGFIETTYPGQDGLFLTKRMPVSEMPYAQEHMIDGDYISETDIAVIEYVPASMFPGGGVQMSIVDTDYTEEAVLADSDEGLALLRDAGVDC